MTTVPHTHSETTASGRSKVLIVDDDREFIRMVRWILEDEGYSVASAADGKKALEVARTIQPSLVVLDLNLPLVPGEQVAAELPSACGRSVPVVVVSGDAGIAERARRMGAAGWLRKPFEIDELVAVIGKVLPSYAASVDTSEPIP